MTGMNGPLRIGIGGPVGAGKTTLTAALCRPCATPTPSASSPMTSTRKRMRRRWCGCRPWRRTGSSGWKPAAARTPRSARMPRSTWPRSTISARGFPASTCCLSNRAATIWRRPSARTCRSHDLCHRRLRRRQDPAQGRPRHHPLRPAGDQQDRPRAAGRRQLGGDGSRQPTHARRKASRFRISARASGSGADIAADRRHWRHQIDPEFTGTCLKRGVLRNNDASNLLYFSRTKCPKYAIYPNANVALARSPVFHSARSISQSGLFPAVCCGLVEGLKRAGTGLLLQARTTHAAPLEADIQRALKLGHTLHRRMTAPSPEQTCPDCQS